MYSTLPTLERIIITNRLLAFGGNRVRAAESLGISVRGLRIKINQYRLAGHEIPSSPWGGDIKKNRITLPLPEVTL